MSILYDEELVAEVTALTATGHSTSKSFAKHQAALEEAEDWLGILRRCLPPETVCPIGILVDGDRVVVFNAVLWLKGEVDLEIASPCPILHMDPRLKPEGAVH